MDSDLTQLVGEVWQHKPILIILVVAGLIIFVLSVIDTHRHRKKTQKDRNQNKKH